MIRYIAVVMMVFFAFAKANSSVVQNYLRHQVEQGDTVYKIINKYGITAEQLIELNPDVKMGLKSGATLLIPKTNEVLTTKAIERYEEHKVRRKETLYTLAKEYNVTVLDIKEANKKLYSESLQKGDKIRIPVFGNQTNSKIVIGGGPQSKDQNGLTPGQYVVQKSEGKYRVAKKHNISIEILNDLNPGVDELKEGMLLNVPFEVEERVRPIVVERVTPSDDKSTVTEVKTDDKVLKPGLKYVDYVVQPKMTMYSLEKMTGLKEDSLIALNPSLKEGVRAGMTLRIPYKGVKERTAPESWKGATTYARLVDSIKYYKGQRIAVLLPLSVKNTPSSEYESLLKSDRTMRIATDFYSGMMVARDSAKVLGVNVIFDVYDTGKNESTAVSIAKNNDFKKYNSVIGPLMAKNVVAVAKELRDEDIPVVSPLTNTDVKLYKNLFQARPDSEFLMNRLKSYLVDFAKNKNVIIVTDNKKPELKQQFAPLFPNARILYPDKNNYISKSKYSSALSSEQDNVVILAVDHVGFLTDAVSNYAAKSRTYNITMVGMDDYESMGINNMGLAAVNYTFPKMNRNTSSENIFATQYFKKHGITPSEFATRGFDVAMDVILRQASAGDLYQSATRNGKTVMVENSFQYTKKFLAGYYNESAYILRYQPDLSIEEVAF